MRLLLFFFSFLVFMGVISAQNSSRIFLATGLNYPEIGFLDSGGKHSLLSDVVNPSSNHISLAYQKNFSEKLGFMLSASSNRYQLRTRYISNDEYVYVNYDFDYSSLALSLTFDLPLAKRFELLLSGGLSYDNLVSGFQEFNNNTYNLKENKDYQPFGFSLDLGANLAYRISTSTQLNLGYSYIYGLNQNENTTKQVYNINSHTVFIGLAVSTDFFKRQKNREAKVDRNINQLKKSFAKLKNQVDSNKVLLDNLFIEGTNINSQLQDEIQNHLSTYHDSSSNNSYNFSVPDFVILFPNNDPNYYDVFEDDMLDLLSILLDNPSLSVKAIGYADLTGRDKENLLLSKNRAITVRDYLMEYGVEQSLIDIEYRGSTSIFDDAVLMSNRRVEIFITTK